MDKTLQLLRTLLPKGYDVVAQDFLSGDYLIACEMLKAVSATQINSDTCAGVKFYTHATRIRTEWVNDLDAERIHAELELPLVPDRSVIERLSQLRKDLIANGFTRESAEQLAPRIARLK